jgi:hypothetical protein
VLVPRRVPQAGGKTDDDIVADGVAEAVVDLLEVIEIGNDQRDWRTLRAPRAMRIPAAC